MAPIKVIGGHWLLWSMLYPFYGNSSKEAHAEMIHYLSYSNQHESSLRLSSEGLARFYHYFLIDDQELK